MPIIDPIRPRYAHLSWISLNNTSFIYALHVYWCIDKKNYINTEIFIMSESWWRLYSIKLFTKVEVIIDSSVEINKPVGF